MKAAIPPSVLINNPQASPRIETDANERGLLTCQQILRRAASPLGGVSTPTPTGDSTIGVRPTEFTRLSATPAIAPALGARLTVVLLRG